MKHSHTFLVMLSGGAAVLVSLAVACTVGDVAYIGRQRVDPLSADSGPACTTSCSGSAATCGIDYCTRIPMLPEPPVLDGELDCSLPLASFDASNFQGNETKPTELAAKYAVAWRPEGLLYMYIHVTENQRLPSPDHGGGVFCGDATHLFVDSDGVFAEFGHYDDGGTFQYVEGAPDNDTTAVTTGITVQNGEPLNPANFRAFPKPDGYVVEAILAAPQVERVTWTLAENGRIGFSFSVSVGGLPGMYPGQAQCAKRGDFFLRSSVDDAGTGALPHSNTAAFCTPLLSGAL